MTDLEVLMPLTKPVITEIADLKRLYRRRVPSLG